jgi:hypothetical protein
LCSHRCAFASHHFGQVRRQHGANNDQQILSAGRRHQPHIARVRDPEDKAGYQLQRECAPDDGKTIARANDRGCSSKSPSRRRLMMKIKREPVLFRSRAE